MRENITTEISFKECWSHLECELLVNRHIKASEAEGQPAAWMLLLRGVDEATLELVSVLALKLEHATSLSRLSSECPYIKGWCQKAQNSSSAWPDLWLWAETPTKHYHFQKASSALDGHVPPILKQEPQQFLDPSICWGVKSSVSFRVDPHSPFQSILTALEESFSLSPLRNSDWKVGFFRL